MVVCAFNSNAAEAETGRFLELAELAYLMSSKPVRNAISKKGGEGLGVGMVSEEQHLRLSSDLHHITHTYTHTSLKSTYSKPWSEESTHLGKNSNRNFSPRPLYWHGLTTQARHVQTNTPRI